MHASKADDDSVLCEAFCGMLRIVVSEEKAPIMSARFFDSAASFSNAFTGLGVGEFASALGLGRTYDPARQCNRSSV